jgi:hypothetical protein
MGGPQFDPCTAKTKKPKKTTATTKTRFLISLRFRFLQRIVIGIK